MANILRNPVPTAGEIRMARSRSEPVVRYLRWGAYFGLGLGLAGLSVRSLRNAPAAGEAGDRSAFPIRMARRGETVLGDLRSNPSVNRVTAEAARVGSDLASKVEVAADEAHDSVEELYGRSYAWLGDLRRRLARSRD